MIFHIGTSGWSDPGWRELFYPEELPSKDWLSYYAGSSAQVPSTPIVTAETAYFRFHGLTGGYRHNYSDDELKEWAERIKKLSPKECFIYFNNDYQAHAVENAKTLEKMLA